MTKYYKEYPSASRKRKSDILNILEHNTGLHRKHLIRKLSIHSKQRKKKPRGGSKPKYPPKETKEILELVWKSTDYSCGELVHPQISETIDALLTRGYLDAFSSEIIGLVRLIPLGTLKVKLKKLTKPPSFFSDSSYQNRSRWQLKKQVPINTRMNLSRQAGCLELDFVDHNGGNSSGSFVRSLCCVDVFTQYVSRYSIRGKHKSSVICAFDNVLEHMPFRIRELHTDNEPNLLTSMVLQQASRADINISRSRSYRKEDNGHVEQKNGDKIRRLVGYKRYDTEEEVKLLNIIYSYDDIIQNHFVGSRRVVEKVYDEAGRVIKRRYDTAKTPHQRVMESCEVSKEAKEKLKNLHLSLDPLKLVERRNLFIKKLRAVR